MRQNCVTCHSGAQPASGMRLDRKSAVINRRGIVPGSAENSFLFHRISGNDYGMQMPPTGALKKALGSAGTEVSVAQSGGLAGS